LTTTKVSGPAQVDASPTDPRTARTGASATNLVTDQLLGLRAADVWVASDDDLSVLRHDLGLLISPEGNVTVRVASVPDLPTLGTDPDNVYRLVVAVTLLEAAGPRARSAGAALLATALQERPRSTAR
jgi:hypothetical protein